MSERPPTLPRADQHCVAIKTNTVWLSSPQVDSDAGGFERPALQGGGRYVDVTTKPRHEGQERLRHLYYHAIMDDDKDQSDLVLFETID